jgi:tetratricopeptide (TPR) repeat protein
VLRRLDESGQALQEERTIVDNISRRGARVMTSMNQTAVGALVELEEVGGDFRVRATVRARHTGGDHIPRLGLRFENASAPDRLVQTDDMREATRTTRIPNVPAAAAAAASAASVSSARPAADEPGVEKRSATRLESPLEVRLKRLGAGGAVIGEERTMAENIGRGGARVMTTMGELRAGDTVIFEEVGGHFQTRAAIQNVYAGADRVRRLNLQFVETLAPDHLVPPDDLRAGPAAVATTLPAASQPEQPSGDLRRQEVLEAYDFAASGTHFEVLGLPRACTAAQVKEAHARLAQRYHPDSGLGAKATDLRAEIIAIFIRLGEAHQVLSDPERRAAYETRLGPSTEATFPIAGPAPSFPSKGSHPSEATTVTSGEAVPDGQPSTARTGVDTGRTRIARAERTLASARKLIHEEKYWDAIQAIGVALRDAGSPTMKRRLQVLLTQATMRNPNWHKRAEAILMEVLAGDPSNVEAHFELARLYQASGLEARARRAFLRVLELDPAHKGAADATQAEAP